MFSSFFSGGLPKLSFNRASTASTVNVPSVEVHDVETSLEKRDRRLKHLLKLNHANFSILYNHNRFHNHTPHILGSAYILGGSADHLTEIYEHVSHSGHEPWQDSPSEIALHDYRDFLARKEYQRAWVDFFEDQLVEHSYDWKQVAARFLFERGEKGSPNERPMFSCLMGGLGHPLIHLGYAYELASREVGMEALGLAATCYDGKLAALLEDNLNTTSSNSTSTPIEDLTQVFENTRKDIRLDAHFSHLNNNNLEHLLSTPALTSILLEHFTSYNITSAQTTFQQSQHLAVALLVSTSPSLNGHGYDFFLLHVLTTSHAIRVLIPFLPSEHHVPLLKQWLLTTLALYVTQLRPDILAANHAITDYDTKGKTWDDATKMALEGKHKFDEHYVKGIRAIREASKVYGDSGEWFEKAAVKFAVEFEEWGGFAVAGGDDVEGKERHIH
ncbi:hypothetical protein LTS08_004064 [Lithohypha guttulata]|uniref:uncharacterized protein n=1 Tax=Lithohypha guttulata TaxID=1690604 RepID=UPI002DE1C0D2|nr:hypothetical protein LTR51_000921 [Lithohypha guttulata]KAK5103257.1 hypothetical protein LTS08_004064 [Lithohypha guttulata]